MRRKCQLTATIENALKQCAVFQIGEIIIGVFIAAAVKENNNAGRYQLTRYKTGDGLTAVDGQSWLVCGTDVGLFAEFL